MFLNIKKIFFRNDANILFWYKISNRYGKFLQFHLHEVTYFF